MGHSQSTANVDEDFKSYATSSELSILNEILNPDHSKSDAKTGNIDSILENLKNHLKQHFQSELATCFCTTLKQKCVQQSAHDVLVEEICKVCFGGAVDRFNFAFDVLQLHSSPVTLSALQQFISCLFKCSSHHSSAAIFGNDTESFKSFVASHIDSSSENLNRRQLLSIFQNSQIMSELTAVAFRYAFFSSYPITVKDLQSSTPCLLPELVTMERYQLSPSTTLLHVADVLFLNNNLPAELQHKWRFLYSTGLQGESFSKLSTQITDKGPLLLIVKDQGGYIFGGFISTNLAYSSQFQGTSKSFLFTIRPKLCVYSTTEYNDHYVYFNTHQETMPNGLGMGGQHNFFGLWLSAEFGKGHSKAKPTCTTYKSPQLSCTDEFSIDALEVWGLGEEPSVDEDEEEEGMTSVIDKNPDAVAILRIAGKERVSEGFRDSEVSSAMPETTELQHPHDPMDYP